MLQRESIDRSALMRARREQARLDELAIKVNGAVVRCHRFLDAAEVLVVSMTIRGFGAFELFAESVVITILRAAEDSGRVTPGRIERFIERELPALGLLPDTTAVIHAVLSATVPRDLDLAGYNVRFQQDGSVQIVRAGPGGDDIRTVLQPFRSLREMFDTLVRWTNNGHLSQMTGQQALCLFQRAATLLEYEDPLAVKPSAPSRRVPTQALLLPPRVSRRRVLDADTSTPAPS
mgnify:FL=1